MSELAASHEDGYVPILKLKEGELRALSDLGPDIKSRLTPLFEMVPSGDDNAPGTHADRRLGRLARVWQMTTPVLIDLHLQLAYDDLDPSRAHELTADAADDHDIVAIPVVRPRDELPFAAAATRLVSDRSLGSMGIRIRRSDALGNLEQLCDQLLEMAHLSAGDTHIVVDLEDDISYSDAELLLQSVPDIDAWASVTLSSAAFERPKSYGLSRIPRDGWQIWQRIQTERLSQGGRHITFGDYGTLRAEYQDFSDVPAGAMRVPVRLVYSGEQNWLHISRRYSEVDGWDHIYVVCREITEQPEWCGESYSPGDEAIVERARDEGSTGGPTEWIRWALSHHFTLVTETLASPPES